jgi:hypothetical protein
MSVAFKLLTWYIVDEVYVASQPCLPPRREEVSPQIKP